MRGRRIDIPHRGRKVAPGTCETRLNEPTIHAMEEARSLFDYVSMGVAVFIILAMVLLLFRTLTLVIGFLSLSMTDSLNRKKWRSTDDPEDPEQG